MTLRVYIFKQLYIYFPYAYASDKKFLAQDLVHFSSICLIIIFFLSVTSACLGLLWPMLAVIALLLLFLQKEKQINPFFLKQQTKQKTIKPNETSRLFHLLIFNSQDVNYSK